MESINPSAAPAVSLLARWSEPSSLAELFHDGRSTVSSASSIPGSNAEMAVTITDTSPWWMTALLALGALYLASEVVFYFYFYWHLLPNANNLNMRGGEPAETYHDYPEAQDRVELLRRIVRRLEQKAVRQSKENGSCSTAAYQSAVQEYLLQWFESGNKKSGKAGSDPAACDPILVAQQLGIPLTDISSANFEDEKLSSSSRPPMLSVMSSSMSASTRTSSGSSSNNSVSSESSGSLGLSGSDELPDQDESSRKHQAASDETSATASAGSAFQRRRHAPWTIPGLRYKAMYDFFAWAFFAKDPKQLSIPEQAALQDCFQCVREETGLVFFSNKFMMENHDSNSQYQPRRLSLEKVNAMHRPWMIYAIIRIGQWMARTFLLPALGFEKVTAESVNLVAWHRPAIREEQRDNVCLFFHGIAPSGLLCYMPMIQALLGKRQQSLVMFENPSVSCQFHALPHKFQVLSEPDTVTGILEILQHLQITKPQQKLTICGHSFGSCPISWILRRRNDFVPKIHHVVLMDPVTLLLSEPTVMSRFLYSDEDAVIRFVVASELFTEYYLRRHFCWYNSELWMEDYIHGNAGDDNNVPDKWTIILSGRDEIVPAPAVREHVASLGLSEQKCNLVYWPHAKHANCVMSPHRWSIMNKFLFNDDDTIATPKSKEA